MVLKFIDVVIIIIVLGLVGFDGVGWIMFIEESDGF